MTFGDDVFSFAEVVLESLTLVPADFPGSDLVAGLVAQREGVVAQGRDGVLSAPLRQVTRRRNHRERG